MSHLLEKENLSLQDTVLVLFTHLMLSLLHQSGMLMVD